MDCLNFNFIYPKVEIILIAFTHPSMKDLKLYSYKKNLPPDFETTIFTYSFLLYILQNVSSSNKMNQIELQFSLVYFQSTIQTSLPQSKQYDLNLNQILNVWVISQVTPSSLLMPHQTISQIQLKNSNWFIFKIATILELCQ